MGELFTELARLSEEAPPVALPVAPPVSEIQAPIQSLSPTRPSRTEEPERPAERQPSLELHPEPCKVPLHIPMSNSMLESLPMTHISTTLAGGTSYPTLIYLVRCAPVPKRLTFAVSLFCSMQKYLLHHLPSSYRNKNP